MKHTILVLLLGLSAGLLGHLGWFLSQRPCGSNDLDCQLEWMKTELKLSDKQFARIKVIHEESSPRLLALAAQVARMRDEYEAFERERTTWARSISSSSRISSSNAAPSTASVSRRPSVWSLMPPM